MAGKIITIDWPTIAALPSDEYHIKLLNKQQAAVLQALCEYQHWQTRWDNLELSQDELDRFMGDIEFRLMGDETGGFMTVDELIEGICGGLVCAAPKIGAMLATGVSSGFSVDEDGNVTTGGEAGGVVDDTPEDDPLTQINEELAARAGGAIAVRTGVNQLFADLAAYYGADTVEDMTLANAQALIAAKYKVDVALMNAAIADYWAFRGAGTTVIASLNAATLDSKLFCKGITHQAINGVVLAFVGVTVPVKINATALVFGLTQQQLDEWYLFGLETPSTAYETYSCTKIDVETFTFNFATSDSIAYTLLGVWKDNHRFLIEAEGTFTDADNPNIIKDFMWSLNTSTGVKTFEGITLNVVGTTPPTGTTVPYEPTHKYAFTIDKTGSNGGIITKTNGEFSLPNTTGTIIMTITDLGEISPF